MNQKIKDAILRELLFLQNIQSENGGFLSVAYSDREKFSDTETRHTTFYTSLVLSCLSEGAETPLLQSITRKGIGFLLHEKSPTWSWNYWQRNSKEAKMFPYPDDLDDTFVALSCITHYSPGTINEEALVAIIKLLIACEDQAGGPYHTWITERTTENQEHDPWKDIDVAVNSNIMQFLAEQEIELPTLTGYIEDRIDAGISSLVSKYYHSPVSIIYFVSKWYRGPKTQKLQRLLLQQRNQKGLWDNPLETALAVSAYIRLGGNLEDMEKAVAFLLENGGSGDVNHLPYPFFIERITKTPENQLVKNKNTEERMVFYSGSPAFMSACRIEALCLYEKASNQSSVANSSTDFAILESTRKHKHINHVVASTKKYFLKYSPALQAELALSIEKIMQQGIGSEIILLSFLFHASLRSEFKDPGDAKRIIDASIANLLGWIGYTIYDDLLDTEGDIGLLPLANICVREVSNIFRRIFPDAKTFQIFERIVGDIDQANLWEYTSCKLNIISETFTIPNPLPDYLHCLGNSWSADKSDSETGEYSMLAKKSLGHALGPIAHALRLNSLEKAERLEQARLIEEFFIHYLIARQLNDDAHDWLSDLQKGYLNPVIVAILSRLIKKQPSKTEITLSSDTEMLQSIFWYQVIDEISKTILRETNTARGLLKKISVLERADFFQNLLVPIEKSAEKALTERDSMLRFLKAYR